MTTSIAEEKLWHLQHCPLLTGLSQREMRELQDITVMVKLQPQERIVATDQEPGAIWLVKQGLISLTYGDAAGRGSTVVLLGPGDLFGAFEPGGDHALSESAVALKPAILCRMTRAQMEALLHRHPEIAYRITKFSWRRIARLQQRLAEIMTRSVKERLATLLLQIATEHGEDRGGVRSLGLTISHDDLARLVGSSREMVSKVMGQFRASGWVRSSRKTVDLVDLQSLEQISASDRP